MLSLWEKRMILADKPKCHRQSCQQLFLRVDVHQQPCCDEVLSFLLLWLWLLTQLRHNVLLRGKSGGRQKGRGCREGRHLRAPGAATAWCAGRAESCFSGGSLRRKGLKYLLNHLSVGGLLFPSCLSPYCSSRLVGEKGIFLCGEP